MPRPDRSVPSQAGRAKALGLVLGMALGLAGGLASVARADVGVHWRLEASVPVMCAIIAVETPADRPSGLVITTSCNAERYQLVLFDSAGQAGLRTARSSAGPVQISGSAVTITSTRPGTALTVIELTSPVRPDQLSVTLRPI